MSQSIQIFERQLKNKLQYKASSKISPDTFLYKSFKFFDLYNNGYLNKSDFFKAIAKCGVVVDTHNVEAIYNHYSNKTDGNVYYKQFIENLLFSQQEDNQSIEGYSNMGNSQLMSRQQQQYQPSQSLSPQHQQPSMNESRIDKIYQECQTYTEVQTYIKKTLRQRGITSLVSFAVQLKSTDTQRTHKINKQKLRSKLVFLSEKAVELIIRQFDNNFTGDINYAELIYSLKGQLEPAQELAIERAFKLLDTANENELPIDKVINMFKYQQYKDDFARAVKLYCNFQAIDDGVFTDEDFIDFFGFLAFAFADSQQFVNFVQRAYLIDDDARSQNSQRSARSRQFKPQVSCRHQVEDMKDLMQPDFRKNKEESRLNEQKSRYQQQSPIKMQKEDDKRSVGRSQSDFDKKSSTTSVYIKQVEMIVLRIKKRLSSRGTRGFLIFQKSLKNVDTDEDGLITLDQFKQVIKQLKIDITNSQSNLVFDVFDPEATNLISYEEMIRTFKGNVPEKRNELFERVWGTVGLSQEHTTFSQIRHALNFRGHPDIQTGRRHDDQIWKQIQETILLIQQLNGTARSQTVTKKQFYEYFQNLSLTTSEDLLFESILQNFWKMQSKVNINEMYAGSRKLFDPKSKGYLMDHHRYAVKGGSISSNAPYGTSNEPTNYFTEHSKL